MEWDRKTRHGDFGDIMRPDMAKVLVERPRSGGYARDKGYRKQMERTPPEEWRRREGMKARWGGGSKWFSDHLGPLRRFLRSNVGRPWDKVYSEICAGLAAGFPVREHFLRHVFDLVARDVILIDGVPCVGSGLGYGRPLNPRWREELYICPRTGLLRQVRPPRKRRRRSAASS
jgi:hypothetical protein